MRITRILGKPLVEVSDVNFDEWTQDLFYTTCCDRINFHRPCIMVDLLLVTLIWNNLNILKFCYIRIKSTKLGHR